MSFSRYITIVARRIILGSACALVAACLTGCQLAYFLTPEQKEKVPAEYKQIGEKKVGVVVWAEQATLDLDPLARLRVCKPVTYYLKKELPKAKFVEPLEIADLQERSGRDWESMPNYELCSLFKCDLIIRIDLLDYTTRAHSARELRKGRVRGTVNVYGADKEKGSDSLYSTEVVSTYPPDSSRGVIDMTDAEILRAAVEEFGLQVSRKFYDHEIAYTKTGRPKGDH